MSTIRIPPVVAGFTVWMWLLSASAGVAAEVNCKELTADEFKKLASDTVIVCGRERSTAGEIRREYAQKEQRSKQQMQAGRATPMPAPARTRASAAPVAQDGVSAGQVNARLAKAMRVDADTAVSRSGPGRGLDTGRRKVEPGLGLDGGRVVVKRDPGRRAGAVEPQHRVADSADDSRHEPGRGAGVVGSDQRAENSADDSRHEPGRRDSESGLKPGDIGSVVVALKGKPKINKLVGMITEGGLLVLLGENFGSQPGTVFLGNQKLALHNTPQGVAWSDTGIGVKLPGWMHADMCDGGFRVVTKWGASSNSAGIPMQTEPQNIPSSDVNVVSCGMEANETYCNDKPNDWGNCFSSPAPHSLLWLMIGDQSDWSGIRGAHGNCWGAVGPDKGTDKYGIKLRNCHRIVEVKLWGATTSSKDSVTFPSSVPWHKSEWNPAIGWTVTPADSVTYGVRIEVIGPEFSAGW